MKLFEKFSENIKEYPEKVIWADDNGEYTGEYIDRLSGQVYAYLINKELDTDDIVMIRLPRGIAIPACVYGIFKAGLCCMIVADWADEERFEFFKNDSKCTFIIDESVWKEILNFSSMPGWKEPDRHDSAYLVYTSSSTGKPKGVLHEYGDINYVIRDIEGTTLVDVKNERLGLMQPFYDVMSYYTCLYVLYAYCFCNIFPLDINVFSENIIDECKRNNIKNIGFMPKSENVRRAEELGCFEYVYTGYEPVVGIYSETLPILNGYGMTESCTGLAYFVIDKYYDVAPVGKPMMSRPVYIVDENDNILDYGDVGEIVFYNPYMREYLNLPDLTDKAFRGGIFHTGDMGMITPDGNLVVLGRKSECIYSDQGIVVPLFVEIELRKLYPGYWFHVSAYHREDGDRICVFHAQDFRENEEAVKEKLSERLPSYLLPTDFLEVTNIPRLVSGKLNYAKLYEVFNGVYPEKESTETC